LQDSLLVAWLSPFQAGVPPAKLLNLGSVAPLCTVEILKRRVFGPNPGNLMYELHPNESLRWQTAILL
ncbi:hypothetical protein, partial [Paenibacillus silagei]|uniref:hypothetical protein n=1 Tax=Paenibacillus silagei TaxID=1670801 RepID=UPI001AE9AA0C